MSTVPGTTINASYKAFCKHMGYPFKDESLFKDVIKFSRYAAYLKHPLAHKFFSLDLSDNDELTLPDAVINKIELLLGTNPDFVCKTYRASNKSILGWLSRIYYRGIFIGLMLLIIAYAWAVYSISDMLSVLRSL